MRYMILMSNETLGEVAENYVDFKTCHETESAAELYVEKNLANDINSYQLEYIIVGITQDNFNKLLANAEEF